MPSVLHRSVNVGFTGHRPELFADADRARAAVHDELSELHAEAPGSLTVIAGGQRGVDTWAALAAVALEIPFVLVLPAPVEELTRDWPIEDVRVLADLRRAALREELIDARAACDAYMRRNARIAELAHVLIAVWTGVEGGGTAETLAFARQRNTSVREVRLPAAPDAASARGRGI
jgi:DNA recombination-mediator protein A